MHWSDLKSVVADRLHALPYPAHLAAMYVIGRELPGIYSVLLSERSRLLMDKSLEVVRACLESGEDQPAPVLVRDWDHLMVGDPHAAGPCGYLAVHNVFDSLVREVGGYAKPYVAFGLVPACATSFPTREQLLGGPPLILDAGDEVDPRTFQAWLLGKFDDVAVEAGRRQHLEPARVVGEVRMAVFPEPVTPPDIGVPLPGVWL